MHSFYPSGTQPFFFRREGFPDSKSIHIQTVEIPLEDLFSGVAEEKLRQRILSLNISLKGTKQHFRVG